MSRATSPAPPATLQSPTSSRSSLSLDRPQNPRRNRTALRNYYNLPASDAAPSSPSQPADADSAPSAQPKEGSALDAASFDAESYTAALIASSTLHELIAASAGLVSEVRGLDGERKALVYNNYSKLIAARETIGKMQGSMGEVGPLVEGLRGSIAALVKKAEALGGVDDGADAAAGLDDARRQRAAALREQQRRRMARWALAAPQRLEALLRDGKREEAEEQSEAVRRFLDKWDGVTGAEELRLKIATAMAAA